jgi:hypothetical protein
VQPQAAATGPPNVVTDDILLVPWRQLPLLPEPDGPGSMGHRGDAHAQALSRSGGRCTGVPLGSAKVAPASRDRYSRVALSAVTIHGPTGCLLIQGKRVFPIMLSNPPPANGKTPDGRNGLAEVAAAGVSFVRTGMKGWSTAAIGEQIASQGVFLDQAAAQDLRCWLWLGDLPNLPVQPGGPKELLIRKIVAAFKNHPGLGAYKGIDEPANPAPANRIPIAALVRARQRIAALDPNHPLVIIQAPKGTVAELTPYRPTFDITGADIYPISYPPGLHGNQANKDISVVGDTTKKMVAAAGTKPVWMTLQICWSGAAPSAAKPDVVPRFPTLHEERFMAYHAIVNGARGLNFFGGHMTQVTRPAEAATGWNWTFWERVLRPLVAELSSTAVGPALIAPASSAKVKASASDIELVTRENGGFLYVIAVRRGGATSRVTFSGLPLRRDRKPIAGGQVLFDYVQVPPPPPIQPGHQTFRSVKVTAGGFADWFGRHDARVYRFKLA